MVIVNIENVMEAPKNLGLNSTEGVDLLRMTSREGYWDHKGPHHLRVLRCFWIFSFIQVEIDVAWNICRIKPCLTSKSLLKYRSIIKIHASGINFGSYTLLLVRIQICACQSNHKAKVHQRWLIKYHFLGIYNTMTVGIISYKYYSIAFVVARIN